MGTTKQSLHSPSLLTSLLHKSMLWQVKTPRLRSQKCSELPERQEKEKSSIPVGILGGGWWCSMLQEKEGVLSSLQSHLQGSRRAFFLYSTSITSLTLSREAREKTWEHASLPAPHPLLICIPPCEEVGAELSFGKKGVFQAVVASYRNTWSFKLQTSGAHNCNQWMEITFLWLKPGGRLKNMCPGETL